MLAAAATTATTAALTSNPAAGFRVESSTGESMHGMAKASELARARGLSFCRPMVHAGQARRLLAESSVLGAVRGDVPFIR